MTKENQALYRKLSQPHADMDAAKACLNAFWADVEKAREAHRIPDLVMYCAVNVILSDNEETSVGVEASCGDGSEHEAMAARLLGSMQAQRLERISALLSRAKSA